jgi:hypothetical protein
MQISPSKAKTQQVLAKKSVGFYEIVSIRSTTHYKDMTSQEIANAWFSRSEMLEIKRNMAIEIKCMSSGTPLLGGTTRGLEFRTREGSNRRKANKLNSINAVLDEQDAQIMHDQYDPEALRSVYLQHSQRCLTESHLLAKGDEIEVKLFHEESGEGGGFFRKLFAEKRALMREIRISQQKEL